MKYLIASGSRSGSMFSIDLLDKFAGQEMLPIAKVNSARKSVGNFRPSYQDYREAGKIVDFVTKNRITTLKLEDPGIDNDAAIFFDAFPECIILATNRSVDQVVNSHGNIRPWGFPPEKAVRVWIANLAFYETAQQKNRLVLIPLESPSTFNMDVASQKLGLSINDDVRAFVKAWPRVNNLQQQKRDSNDNTPVDFHMSRDELVARFPEILDAERRYTNLTLAANTSPVA